jgi:hypothetical protein
VLAILGHRRAVALDWHSCPLTAFQRLPLDQECPASRSLPATAGIKDLGSPGAATMICPSPAGPGPGSTSEATG